MTDLLDLWGAPPQSFSFDGEPPINISGIVTDQRKTQQTDYDTREPLFWDEMKQRPRMKIEVDLQTDLKDTDDDDGMRTVHVPIPSAKFRAIRDGIKKAHVKTMMNGDHLSLTYTVDMELSAEDKKRKRSPQKDYEAEITPRSEFATR
jgi:hypothetical protein